MSGAGLGEKLKLLLDQHPVFSFLGEDGIQKLMRQLEMVSFSIGEDIVGEGEEGNAAFLIFAGKVRIHKLGPAGKPVLLGTLGAGDLFGEQSLIQPGPRMASARAAEDVILFRIDRADFKKLLSDHPELAPYLERLMRQRSSSNFLRLATFLGVLPARQVIALLDQLQDCSFPSGEFIVREGEVGDRMYIIRSGEVRVLRGRAETTLAILAEGDYFGERALILQEPRYASVVATTPVACYSLSRQALEGLVAAAPQLHEQLRRRLEQYPSTAVLAQAPALPSPGRARSEQPASDLVWEKVDDEPGSPTPGRSHRNWWLRLLRPFPFVAQDDESDCGAAALAMIGRFHGLDVSRARLRDLAHVGADGASMLSLAQAAQASGLCCRPVHTDFDHLRGLALPAVAHWQGHHYVVLYQVADRQVVVGDPARGLVAMSRQQFEAGWTGRLLLLTVDRAQQEKRHRSPVARRALLWLAVRLPSRRSGVALTLVSLLLASLPLVLPPLASTVMERFLLATESGLLLALSGGMLLVAAFQVAFVLVRRVALQYWLPTIASGTSADWFGRLLNLPLKYTQSRTIGSMLLRLEGSELAGDIRARLVLAAVLDLPMLVVGLVMMLAYPGAALLFGLPMIGSFLIWVYFSGRGWQRLEQQAALRKARTTSALVESIQALGAIKDSLAEAATRQRFADADGVAPGRREPASAGAGPAAANLLVNAAVLCYGVALVASGTMTSGQLVALQTLVVLLAVPILEWAGLWRRLLVLWSVAPRVAEVQEATAEQDPSLPAVTLPTLRGLVQLDNLSFRYHPESPLVLSRLNLVIEPGRIVAIMGRSGSGKTTLALMLDRLLSPSEGTVRIDGFDLRDAELASLRAQVSIVGSETAIVAGSIRDNIALADPAAPLDRVIEAARLANAHEFIMALPAGYDTLIGPGGLHLSTGQRQCLGLARAFWKEPRILVLDDVWNALDIETEQAVMRHLRATCRARTSILMSRRRLAASYADTIVIMDAGQIVETGNHQELMAQKGLYHYWTTNDVKPPV